MATERKIKFYSEYDSSSSWYLHEIETVFRGWSEYICSLDINTVLELYNIKKYHDTFMQANRQKVKLFWDYKEICEEIPRILGKFCKTISTISLESLYNATDPKYANDFWELICRYKVYPNISPESLEQLLNSDDRIVWGVLQQNDLTKHFGKVIALHLSRNDDTAPCLISQFLTAHHRGDSQLFFPTDFTQDLRDKVLSDYVEQEHASINDLQLLEQAQSSKDFPISDRLRLKARKKKEELRKKLFKDGSGITCGTEVTFKSIPDGSIKKSRNGCVTSYSYSREWVESNTDYPTLLNNFIYLFGYVDLCFRCTCVSLRADLKITDEHFAAKGKNAYICGIAFKEKQFLSIAQMAAYNHELTRLNIRLEDIFKWFFEEYLATNFEAKGFSYAPPSEKTTLVEKCKLLAIAIDGILKQYRLYAEEGNVDRELLEMSSGHIVFSLLKSTMQKKYAYSNSDNLQTEMFLLFSNQSMMRYTKRTASNYKSLPQLLISEKIKKEDFDSFQLDDLDWLIGRGAVLIAGDGQLLINKARVFVLKDLFYNEVVCPTYYSELHRREVESFVATGDMRYECTLFTKPEQDYLNYILNKSEFTNGLDLRNKYSHDTCSLDEKTLTLDYMELQKIMVLIMIKLTEEVCAKRGYPEFCVNSQIECE